MRVTCTNTWADDVYEVSAESLLDGNQREGGWRGIDPEGVELFIRLMCGLKSVIVF